MQDLLNELENRCESLLSKVALYREERDLIRKELDLRNSYIAEVEAENKRLRSAADSIQESSEKQGANSSEGKERLLHLLKRINSAS